MEIVIAILVIAAFAGFYVWQKSKADAPTGTGGVGGGRPDEDGSKMQDR